MPHKRQDRLRQVMHFQQSKKAISTVHFKWAIFSLNNVLMERIWVGNNEETLLVKLLENFLASTSRSR